MERANAKQKRLENFLAPLGLELGRGLLVLAGKVGERKVDPESLGVDLDQLLDNLLQASQSILSEKTRLCQLGGWWDTTSPTLTTSSRSKVN